MACLLQSDSGLMNGKTVLLQLLGKYQKLVSALPTIFFFRHSLLSFTSILFARLTFCSINLRLQSGLFVQRTTCHAFLHALQRKIVIIKPWLFLNGRRFSLCGIQSHRVQQEDE